MFWLSLIVGIQFLGFGITLVRLAYDEWQQWRISREAQKIHLGRPDLQEVQAMENKIDNLILPGRGADRGGERVFSHFSYPHEAVLDPDLDMDERCSILAGWASDVHAVESMPPLSYLPWTPASVTLSSIMNARARLDCLGDAANDDDPPPTPRLRRSGNWHHLEVAA